MESQDLSGTMQSRRPRQVPVSCQLCRSMKLKCNREQPCSNCSSRGITCEPAYRASHPLHKKPAAPVKRQQQEKPGPSTDSGEILARLKRLEDVVLNSKSQKGLPASPISPTYRACPPIPPHISEGDGISKWLEGLGTGEVSGVIKLPVQTFPFSWNSC